jgi:hypothetical protein
MLWRNCSCTLSLGVPILRVHRVQQQVSFDSVYRNSCRETSLFVRRFPISYNSRRSSSPSIITDTIEANDALNTIVRNTSNVKMFCWQPRLCSTKRLRLSIYWISCDSTTGAVNWMSRITDNDGNLTNSSGLAQACRGYISYGVRPYDISWLSPSVSTVRRHLRGRETMDGSVMHLPQRDDRACKLRWASYRKP